VITRDMVPQLARADVVDPNGEKIGTVGQIWLEEGSHEPAWVSVRTGLFGMKETFVPLQGAEADADAVHVAVHKDQVKEAPRVEADGQLAVTEEQRLYEHYGLGPQRRPDHDTGPAGMRQQNTRSGGPAGQRRDPAGRQDLTRDLTGQQRPGRSQAGPDQAGRDQAGRAGVGSGQHSAGRDGRDGPERDGSGRDGFGRDGDQTMIRSEERLRVGTESTQTGRVRLRKYVVTENQQMSVPVRHEEIRIEREPISEAEAARVGTGEGVREEQREITLHAERPVVTKETVPVERVRLGTEVVTENQTVSDQVRKERIDIDQDGGRREDR
jgi:uncharacterized protein (TIGR02271 family)